MLKDLAPGKLLFIAHRNELLTQAKGQNPSMESHVEDRLGKGQSHADPNDDCNYCLQCLD